MAISCLIRKASHTVVPLTLRAIASPRILSSFAIKAAEHGGERLDIPHHSNFSTVSETVKRVDHQKNVEALKSEIKFAADHFDIQLPEAPTGFPYKIEDIPGVETIKLTREFAGEKIVVVVENPIDSGESTIDDDGEKRSINFDHTYVPFHVEVSKGNGKTLKMFFSADCDCIETHQIYYDDEKKRVHDEIKLDHEGFWTEFIRGRGIDDSIGEFLIEYMTKRQARDYLLFLKKFMKFVKE